MNQNALFMWRDTAELGDDVFDSDPLCINSDCTSIMFDNDLKKSVFYSI